MRNLIKAASFCLLAVFALTACGCGGEKDASSKANRKSRDEKQNNETPVGGYLTKPFDPTVAKLPPGFIGCDASAIYPVVLEALWGDEWIQGEYEKTADYEKRTDKILAELGQKTLIGDLKFSSTLAFTLRSANAPDKEEKDLAVKTSYEADSETLSVSAAIMKNGSREGLDLQRLSARDEYTGENSFGVKKEIARVDTITWGILFTEGDSSYSRELVWRLRDVSPEKAKATRDDVGTLCVCKLLYEDRMAATDSDKTEIEPTIDSPLELNANDYAVRVTEPEFWLYNVKTGEVLAKWSWEETDRGVAKRIGDLTVGETSEKPEPESSASVPRNGAFENDEEEPELEEVEEEEEETVAPSLYATEPFDPKAKTLPPNYRGHDPEAIYKAVAALIDESEWKKDEFEKTTDYRKRVDDFWQTLQDETLVGDVKFSSPLAFAFAPERAAAGASASGAGETVVLRSAYDADAETLTFNAYANLKADRPKGDGYGELRGLRFKGAEYRNEYGVVYTERYINAEFKLRGVEPSVAKELAGKVGALCVCNLTWRRGANGERLPKSCFDGKAVWVTEPVFWLYNVETGEVLAKFELAEVEKKTAKRIGAATGETADESRGRGAGAWGSGKASSTAKDETAEEKAEREAKASIAAEATRERRRAAQLFQAGERSRIASVKKLTSCRDGDAPLVFNVPKDCPDLREAIDKAEQEFMKKRNTGPIPRIVLDAGEYDASGLTLKTFVDIQSATGDAEDVILNVDAASPIIVEGETVAEFDGVTLRQIGSAESGACVEVKRGVALFVGCAFNGQMGAKSSTGVKAVGLKSAASLNKCRAIGFSLSALHVEDGAFGWATETAFGPENRFGASSKNARLEVEKCEFRGNDTGLYFRGAATGGAQGCVYAENKRDAQIVDGAKVEVDAPNVEEK